MSERTNTRVLLNKRPVGEPKDDDFKIETVPATEPQEGELLIKALWLSLDPYMRGRMNDAESYAPPVQLGEVMVGETVNQVVVSKSPDFAAGDIVIGEVGWQEYATVPANPKRYRKVNPDLGPISTALHALGMTGRTAYFGLLKVGEPKPGETVVDLGSGGGFDCFLAAKEVGETGQVIGIDMTPDMISKARRNADNMSAGNVEFRMGEIEHLPVADNTADIIMSNCVINLSPEKQQVYKDAFRVLKPGGRLAISDVLATAELPDEIKNDLALVAACIGGAATIKETEEMLKSVGFQEVKVETNRKSQELLQQWDPEKSSNAGDYVVSAYVEGIKPV